MDGRREQPGTPQSQVRVERRVRRAISAFGPCRRCTRCIATGLIAGLLMSMVVLPGCESGFERIDRRVNALMAESSSELGPESPAPTLRPLRTQPEDIDLNHDPTRTELPTINPPTGELPFTAMRDSENIADRLAEYRSDSTSRSVLELDLSGAISYAFENSREFRFAEEEYILSSLRLLIERHLWGPRFFNDVSATVTSNGDDGLFDSSLRVVNEFQITQRLPYGGEVSARALAAATEDLHRRVAGENTQTADLIFSANVPLLRGAGSVAREDLIQAERDIIYAARDFERFRREFVFAITSDFLDLVVRSQNIANARRQVESLIWLEDRSRALRESGRESPLDVALAEQATLFARDSLNGQLESYRLAVDRFKVRLGAPEETVLEIVQSDPGLPTPEVSLDMAMARAMAYRLDLQNRRDQLDDARRGVSIARNQLLPDLDLFGSVAIPTDDDKQRAGADFEPDDASFEAGVTFGLPLDREIERLNVRQAQINLERALRSYDEFRDNVAVDIRSAVRDIDRALFSLQIQQENVRIAERGMESIEAAPDRSTARDRTEAVDRLLRAQDQLDSARRDLQIAVLRYLLNSGQLRIGSDGRILPLEGMQIAETAPPPAENGGMDG